MFEQEHPTQWNVAKINSIHGKSLWYCKDCQMTMQVKEHITGVSREDDYHIYWNYIVDEYGHTLEDWSH